MMSTLEVCQERLLGNVRAIERVIAEAADYPVAGADLSQDAPGLLAVVKADGYGHSATLCAPLLVGAGVSWLGVTDSEEGAAVRESLGSGSAEILVMSGPPGEVAGAQEAAALAVRHRLTPVVWTEEQLGPIAAASEGEPCPVHLEIDTGMSRQGVAGHAALKRILTVIAGEPRVRLDGVFTHLASAESGNARQTVQQIALFEEAVRLVGEAGFKPRWVHLGNASTIDNGSIGAAPTLAWIQRLAGSIGARAFVRCGLALYGYCLPIEGMGLARLRDAIRPVLAWKTTITSLLEIAAGTSVGYGATFTAERPMRLALLPVGYADGLRRGLSSMNMATGGWVMIGGKRASIVGRVSMNLTTVDVTDFEAAPQVGDAVTLLGDGVTADDHARLCAALPYEILCGLRGRHIRC